jgi:hypothetical protein
MAEISGPTLANPPSLTDTWWTGFMSFIKSNGSIPDQYAWHSMMALFYHLCLLTVLLPIYTRKIFSLARFSQFVHKDKC